MLAQNVERTSVEHEAWKISEDWRINPRWQSVTRPYSESDVLQLRVQCPAPAVSGEAAAALWRTLQQRPRTVDDLDFTATAACIAAQSGKLEQTFDDVRQIAAAGYAAAMLDVGALSFPASHLVAARLAADVVGYPLALIAQIRVDGETDAFAMACACAGYADVLWYETDRLDLSAATDFARQVHQRYPQKLLMFCCPAEAEAERLRAECTALMTAGFSGVTSRAICTSSTSSSAGLSAADHVERIVALGLEKGASPDLCDEIFSDETIDRDLT